MYAQEPRRQPWRCSKHRTSPHGSGSRSASSGVAAELQRPDIRQEPGHPAPPTRRRPKRDRSQATLQRPDIRPIPGHLAPRDGPDIRRPATGRTSGACPVIRRTLSREQKNRPLQPGHPARGPDLRLLVSRRTSGPSPDIRRMSAHSERAKGPCIPPLTYPFVG